VQYTIQQSDCEYWYKTGRGHVFQFLATPDEVVGIINDNLPKEYAPYRIEYLTSVEKDGTYRKEYRSILPDELPAAHADFGDDFADFWLRSLKLTPDLTIDPELWTAERTLSMNSFIEIRFALPGDEIRFPASISVIEKWEKPLTDEFLVIERPEYYEIFKALKRNLRKRLCYSTLIWHITNRAYVEWDSMLMTEGFKRKIEEEGIIRLKPGKQLREK